MTTQDRLDINRANAQKSTGPKIEEGNERLHRFPDKNPQADGFVLTAAPISDTRSLQAVCFAPTRRKHLLNHDDEF